LTANTTAVAPAMVLETILFKGPIKKWSKFEKLCRLHAGLDNIGWFMMSQ